MQTTFIYGLWDPRTLELRYIGKSYNPKMRLKVHIREAYSNGNNHKLNWIRQLLGENLEPSVDILEEVNILNWQECEIKWILECKQNGLNLVNTTDGGEGITKGHKLSEEHKKKISNATKGKVVSEETRKNMSIAFSGRKLSDEHKKKISKSHKGKKLTNHHVEAIKKANKGNKYCLGLTRSDEFKEEKRKGMIGNQYALGYKHTDEMRKHLSECSTGQVLSDEAKEKIRQSKLGIPRDDKTKEKLRQSNLGKKRTEESKRKQSVSMKKRWAKKKEKNVKN